MPEEKPQGVDGFVDGVRRIKYSDGFSDFDFAIEMVQGRQRVRCGSYVGPEYLVIFTGWAHNIMVAGKLGYVAGSHVNRQVMNFGGVEGPEYYNIHAPLVGIEGKLLYIARKENGSMVANFDNVEGKEYSRAICPSNIAGKPAYKAEITEKGADGKFTRKWVVVFDGVEGPKYFDVCANPREVHGKLAYLALHGPGQELVLNYDGIELDNRYKIFLNAVSCDGIELDQTGIVVDGKCLIKKPREDKVIFGDQEILAPSIVHVLVEYELAKQRGGNEK